MISETMQMYEISFYNPTKNLFEQGYTYINGEKVSYIVATLSLRYGISERKVYDLIKRFKTDCNLCAV